jgi:hypothetical protein
MEVHTTECDLCHIQKASTNHWYRIYLGPSWIAVQAAEMRLEVDLETTARKLDCCGQACVTRAVSEYLSGARK